MLLGYIISCSFLKDINSSRRHEEKPKKNLRVLRVFVVKCLKVISAKELTH